MSYARGASAERQIAQQLQREGYLVVRSAGSKGPIDLVAIDGRRVMLIQVKRGRKAGPAERAQLEQLAARLPKLQVWLYERDGRRGAEWRARWIKASQSS